VGSSTLRAKWSAVQVVDRGLRIELRPEQVQDLLAVEAMVLGQSEQLDEALHLLEPPFILPDDSRTHRDGEAAEQADAHGLPSWRRHEPRSFVSATGGGMG
jgi:hypothetical protein